MIIKRKNWKYRDSIIKEIQLDLNLICLQIDEVPLYYFTMNDFKYSINNA